jgi:hypothetical protein
MADVRDGKNGKVIKYGHGHNPNSLRNLQPAKSNNPDRPPKEKKKRTESKLGRLEDYFQDYLSDPMPFKLPDGSVVTNRNGCGNSQSLQYRMRREYRCYSLSDG